MKKKLGVQLVSGSDSLPREPYLMVSNHGTFIDPWIVCNESLKPVAMMMNEDGFKASAVARWYLSCVNAYPKKKGENDVVAMKQTIRYLTHKQGVLIFPEGQVSWDGRTGQIYPGIEKIVKKTKVPLVVVRCSGNFLTKPWWAKTQRSGSILVERKVYQPSELALMEESEIAWLISEGIRHNDLEIAETQKKLFYGVNCALGIERFIWRCPLCGIEKGLYSRGDDLCCSVCDSKIRIDACCRLWNKDGSPFRLSRLDFLVDESRHVIAEKVSIALFDEIIAEDCVELVEISQNGKITNAISGKISLSREKMEFIPESLNGRALMILTSTIKNAYFQKVIFLELRTTEAVFRFRMNQCSTMKWVSYVEAVKSIR